MPSAPLLATFFLTTATFAVIPGPAMLYAAARTLAGGRRAGLLASLGIHLGGYAHVAAAAAGLAILLQTVPVLYVAVRLAGSLYLVWLGLCLARGAGKGTGEVDAAALAPIPAWRAVLGSVGVEVLNPKTALFFLAFLPQFVDATAGSAVAVQVAVLGTIVNVIFSIADVAVVLLAGAVARRLQRSGRATRLMRRTGGAVLVGLGAHLAIQHG